MSQVNISLTGEDAQTLLDMFSKLEQSSTGPEYHLARRLSASLAQQLDRLNELDQVKSTVQLTTEIIRQFRNQVLDMIPVVKNRGMCQQTVSYLNTVEGVFRQAKEKFQPLVKSLPTDLSSDPGSAPALPPQQVQAILAPFIKRIEAANTKLLSSSPTPLEVNEDYPQPSRRARLAQRCFNSSLREARQARDWTAPDMIALCFSDMKSHLDLGLAILHGDPEKIHQASLMDTACRDGVPQSAWEFVLSVCDGTANGYARKSSPSP